VYGQSGSPDGECVANADYMNRNKWISLRCSLSAAAVLHLVGWCVSIFGTCKIGGPFAALCYYSAKGCDYDLTLAGLLFAIVPSAVFLVAAQLNGAERLSASVFLAGLALSVSGWVRYAAATERSAWTLVSWTPYWTAVIYMVFTCGLRIGRAPIERPEPKRTGIIVDDRPREP